MLYIVELSSNGWVQFSFLCFSEDNFLLHTEKTLRGFLLKINACDALLEPIPPGKYKPYQISLNIHFTVGQFSLLTNISRVPQGRNNSHADGQCTFISSFVEINNRGAVI